MRVVLIAILLFSLPSPTTGNKQKGQTDEQHSGASPASNPCSPVTVVVSQPTPEPKKESAQAKTNNWHEWFWPPVWSNWALVLAAAIAAKAAIHTLHAIDSQVTEMRKTGEQTDELIKESIAQSASMERHIEEAARSANAMEAIANKIEAGNKAVMRAYLTVIIGGGVYQERNRVGQPDVKFAVAPTLANTGNTPARNVRVRKKAAILPAVMPDNFTYEDLGPETEAPFATVAAHHNYIINTIVNDFVPDAEVARIKIGDGQNLHVWGRITYDDIFGDTHVTKFGQWIIFIPPNNQILGWYTPGQNDAD